MRVDIDGIHLANILAAMERLTFGKDVAAQIVGGSKRLERLIASDEVRAVKRCGKQNGKWYCNAADVLRHCRDFRNQ